VNVWGLCHGDALVGQALAEDTGASGALCTPVVVQIDCGGAQAAGSGSRDASRRLRRGGSAGTA